MVENVIPLYAGGYGVGQMLPSSYAYYNVPYQYRSLYYDTPDYGYWYAPGAIYQYDPRIEHDHFGRGADVAGLLGRPAAAGRAMTSTTCLTPIGRPTTTRPTPGTATTTATSTRSTRRPRLVTAIVASLLT